MARVAKILDCKILKLSQLNEWICYLDTGYSLAETIKILESMYKFDHTKEDRTIYLYLIKCSTQWLDISSNEIQLDLI